MLYWGYRSPWWLLHGDTLFDSGIGIEAASPSDQPAPYARDSVTQKLDQAQWHGHATCPPLGKDSLGVWLSDWAWNSQIGKERWQEGFVMDLCRGSLLAQPWSDTPWLSPPERRQMAEFIAVLKAQPELLRQFPLHPRQPLEGRAVRILLHGRPKRAFLALHNCCWKDSLLRLELNSAWGLPDRQDLGSLSLVSRSGQADRRRNELRRKTVSLALRPFEIVLLEAVPHGQAPTLNRRFDRQPLPAFAEPSRSLEVAVQEVCPQGKRADETVFDPPWPVPKSSGQRSLVVQGQVPASSTGGMLVISVQMKRGTQPMRVDGPGKYLTAQATLAGETVVCQPVLGTATYPSCWQAWRIAVESSARARPFELMITAAFGPDVQFAAQGHFLPK